MGINKYKLPTNWLAWCLNHQQYEKQSNNLWYRGSDLEPGMMYFVQNEERFRSPESSKSQGKLDHWIIKSQLLGQFVHHLMILMYDYMGTETFFFLRMLLANDHPLRRLEGGYSYTSTSHGFPPHRCDNVTYILNPKMYVINTFNTSSNGLFWGMEIHKVGNFMIDHVSEPADGDYKLRPFNRGMWVWMIAWHWNNLNMHIESHQGILCSCKPRIDMS